MFYFSIYLFIILLLLDILNNKVLSLKQNIPNDWLEQINTLNAFYGEDDTMLINAEGYPGDIYLPLLGNGYLSSAKGVRGDTMFVSGLFNGETTSPSHRARIPATCSVLVEDSTTTGVLFDVRRGFYTRRGHLNNSNSSYELRWYAHRALRSVFVLELSASAVGDLVLQLTNNIGALSEDIDFRPVHYNDTGVNLLCGETKIAETANTKTHNVCVMNTIVPSSITINDSNNHKKFTFITVIKTDLEFDAVDVLTETINEYNNAITLSKTNLLEEKHIEAWDQLWNSGIELHGSRTDIAIAVNISLFSVLSSIRSDWPYGLAPGGLTNYYNGHSFWDTETWMYPPLLLLYPEISKSLINYRYNRLEGAHLKAQSYSPQYNGTMFPWESAYSGVETCPIFADTGLREQHINGDISFAIWQEYLIRKDNKWLNDIGYPILLGIADFWISRVTITSDGIVHINDVIPPDEYVDHVNDSVYTNYVAKLSLEIVLKATKILGVSCKSCNAYDKIVNNINILYNNELHIHPEYDGYNGKLVKQADVVLLPYPLGMEMTIEQRRNDLEYYSNRTDSHGPAMTWGMHSIGYLDLGEYNTAAKFLDMSFKDNTHKPFYVWTETPDGNACNFITGAGGFLQTVTYGYPGIRITDNSLIFTPKCIPGINHIKLREVFYLTSVLVIEYWCEENDYNGVISENYNPIPIHVQIGYAENRNNNNLSIIANIISDNATKSLKSSPLYIHDEDINELFDQILKDAHNLNGYVTFNILKK